MPRRAAVPTTNRMSARPTRFQMATRLFRHVSPGTSSTRTRAQAATMANDPAYAAGRGVSRQALPGEEGCPASTPTDGRGVPASCGS
jgi:hypothetical protein